MKLHECRSLCWFLSLVIALQPILVLQQQLGAQEPEKPAVKEPTPEELAKIADEMEKGFNALEAAEKEIPRDTFDPQAIIDKVGQDPEKLFEWVRDHTYWVPYKGALRGATGVLMDRLGSSLDRSLLLAELLRVAGQEVRLARAELSEEQARALLPKLRAVPKEPLPPPTVATKQQTDAQVEKYAKEFELDGAALHNNMEKISLQRKKLAEDVAQRVSEQTPLILKAIGKPEENVVKAQLEREAAEQLQALRDHWWVQRKDATAWTDLDPLLPDAKAGSSQTASQESFEWDSASGKIVLDGKFCHEVQINVVIEQWTKDGLKEKRVLSHTLRPFELFGERIALQHLPMNWPQDLDFFNEKEPLQKLKTTVLAEKEWLPVLTVGSGRIAKSSFTDSGDINQPALDQLASGLEKGAKGLDPFGRLSKQGGKNKPSSENKLTAEWIDYEVHSPSQPPQKIRRQIFDLLGPAARSVAKVAEPAITKEIQLERGLNLLGETEILPLVCQLSPDYVASLGAVNMIANRDLLTGLMRREQLELKQLAAQVAKVTPLPSKLYNLALARHQWSQFRDDVFLDQVNILSYHSRIIQDKGNELLLCQGFDIVANDIAVRSGTRWNPFLIRFEQGVLDTNAESFLMSGCGKVENTAEFFATASGQGVEWSTIRNTRDPAWHTLELAGDVRTRIEEDLAAGYVVMVPRKPVSVDGRTLVGWWRVDPTTGETLGIGDRGWGQATTEDLVYMGLITFTIVSVVCIFISGRDTGGTTTTREDVRCLIAGAVAGGAVFYGPFGAVGVAFNVKLLGALAVGILGGVGMGIAQNPDLFSDVP